MINLIENSDNQVDFVSTKYQRNYLKSIDWNNRLIGIKGSRGVGKTTILLQYIKINKLKEKAIYISLDDFYFSDNKLIDLVDEFVKKGGLFLFIDEVHLYKNWSQEIKLIYDRYPKLKTVFTGSSILELDRGKADLSRRAVVYTMRGFSLREYVNFTEGLDINPISLEEIIKFHRTIASEIKQKIIPLQKFDEYLKIGYYPFFIENRKQYHHKLQNILNLILEVDIPRVVEIKQNTIEKLRQLVFIIANSVPFKPNISKISEKLLINRNSLKEYFNYLEKTQIISLLTDESKGDSLLSKPEKIYLFHPNLFFAISENNANIGTLRETFFMNQISENNKVNYTRKGDFKVNDFIFEVGGKNKTTKQIQGVENGYLALDGIETGFDNKIPLWLFGFLY